MVSIKSLCNFIEITLQLGCSPVNLLDIFGTPFCKNTSGRLLLKDNLSQSILLTLWPITTQQLKFSIKDFSSNCHQIRSFLRIWSHSPEKSLMENIIFCAVYFKSVNCLSCIKNIFVHKCYKGESSLERSSKKINHNVSEISSRFKCFFLNWNLPPWVFLELPCNFIEIELRHGCSTVNLVLIFRTRFPKSTSGLLLLFGVNHLEASDRPRNCLEIEMKAIDWSVIFSQKTVKIRESNRFFLVNLLPTLKIFTAWI